MPEDYEKEGGFDVWVQTSGEIPEDVMELIERLYEATRQYESTGRWRYGEVPKRGLTPR